MAVSPQVPQLSRTTEGRRCFRTTAMSAITAVMTFLFLQSELAFVGNNTVQGQTSTTAKSKSKVVEHPQPKADATPKSKTGKQVELRTTPDNQVTQIHPAGKLGEPVSLKGEVVWEVDLGGVSGTRPILSSKLCIISVQNNYTAKEGQVPRVVAINRISGKVTWEFQVPQSIPGQCVLWNDLVVFGIDESHKTVLESTKPKPAVIALNVDSGKEQWRKSFEMGTGRGTPLIPRSEGSEFALIGNKIAVLNNGLILLNDKGEVDWHKTDLKYDRIAADKSLLFASKSDRNDQKGEVVAIEPKVGAVKWRHEIDARLIDPSRPVISGDKIFVATSSPANDFTQRFFSGTQYLNCLNRDTGTLIWQKSLRWFEHGGGIQGDVYPLGNRVFLTDVKGRLLLDIATGERIESKAPVLGFGRLYYPLNENTVFTGDEALELSTGKSLWKLSRASQHKHLGGFGSDIKPHLLEGRLYFGSLDGHLLCVK